MCIGVYRSSIILYIELMCGVVMTGLCLSCLQPPLLSIEREPSGEVENRRDSEENKENLRIDQWFTDESGRIFDQESWNDSVISGESP